MRFSKYNQPRHHGGGRKPSAATIAKRQAQAQQERARDAQAFDAFEAADAGSFNGFAMADAFHEHYSKADAVETLTADDCADAVTSAGATIHAGADGAAVYVMTEGARRGDVKKVVYFNRSIYVF